MISAGTKGYRKIQHQTPVYSDVSSHLPLHVAYNHPGNGFLGGYDVSQGGRCGGRFLVLAKNTESISSPPHFGNDPVNRPSREYALIVGEYLAVDVAVVNLASLEDGAQIRSLPTRLVQLPVDDASQIAVLSWR